MEHAALGVPAPRRVEGPALLAGLGVVEERGQAQHSQPCTLFHLGFDRENLRLGREGVMFQATCLPAPNS